MLMLRTRRLAEETLEESFSTIAALYEGMMLLHQARFLVPPRRSEEGTAQDNMSEGKARGWGYPGLFSGMRGPARRECWHFALEVEFMNDGSGTRGWPRRRGGSPRRHGPP